MLYFKYYIIASYFYGDIFHTNVSDEFDLDLALTSVTSTTRSRSTWLVETGLVQITKIAMGDNYLVQVQF